MHRFSKLSLLAPKARLLLPIGACLLLSGCLEGVEHPDALRFEDANVGEAPPPIPFILTSILDEPVTVRAYSWSPEWLSAGRNRVTLQPGESGTVELAAAECEDGGDREGVLAISADGMPAFVRVDMTIVKDGEEHALEGFVPDCPGNCLSAALDIPPLPAQSVEVREHPPIDLGVVEWTTDQANAPFGMAGDVSASVPSRAFRPMWGFFRT